MRVKTAAVALVLLAVAGLVVGTSTAQAPATETITMDQGAASAFKLVQGDRPDRLNPGDVLLSSGPLLDPDTGDRVARMRTVCTLHFGRNMLCNQEITIRGRGRIEVAGVIHLGDAPAELGIVGGTGDFADVAGTVDRTGSPPSMIVTVNVIYH